ncbi:DUF5677 domain-containing protein [Bacillus cereus group sp. BceL062]|uniref:DUF5677 domain-containing protein n=1 Tax=Bacillus cereus group sp. BceL062 TaxID=3445166 RepID=UPI003F1EBF68
MEENLQNLKKSIAFAEEILIELTQCSSLKLEHKIVISLYRQLLEQTCGGYTLAINKLGGPLKIMERSAFETYLALKYILQEDTLIQERAYSYYIGFLQNIQTETYDWAKSSSVDKSLKEDIEKDLKHISIILDNTVFKQVLNEWDNKREKINRNRKKGKEINPKWHSLFDGPPNINQLALSLITKDTLISTYYGSLSKEAHGYNSLKDTNYLTLIDKPLLLKSITYNIHPTDTSPIRALCTGGLAEIIVYLSPKHIDNYLKFLEEIGVDTEIDI